MRKLRVDSTWNRLTHKQLDLMNEWLFEEGLGYAETLERVEKEFGLKASIASLGRHYRRFAHQRRLLQLVRAQRKAKEFNNSPVKVEDLRAAALKLVGNALMNLEGPKKEQLEQLNSLSRLLLDSEHNELQRQRVQLNERWIDFKEAAAAEEEAPHVCARINRIVADTNLSHDEKIERGLTVIFGKPEVVDSKPGLSDAEKVDMVRAALFGQENIDYINAAEEEARAKRASEAEGDAQDGQ